MRSKDLAATGQAAPTEIHVYGALFACAVGAFCLSRLAGDRFGPLFSDVVAIAGDATCGWSWLLVRALFQPPAPRRPIWPLALVLALVATGAVLRVIPPLPTTLPRIVENLANLISATLLLMAAVEPLTGLGPETPRSERRFRIAFSAGYVVILAVAVLWVDGAPTGSLAAAWRTPIKAACAVLALAGMAAAIWRRDRNPLTAAGKARFRPQTAGSAELGERLLRLMREEAVFARQDLRVSGLARRLGEAEYKVTRCISGPLGFRNFNHMANHFRLEEARRRLAGARCDHLPILTIAYDCGFGSIGPFNRAFKAEVGTTPMQFRQAAQKRRDADGEASAATRRPSGR